MLNSIDLHGGLVTRLWNMFIGWGSVGVVYALTSALQGQGITLPETALDRMISFNPVGIWAYLSFFALIPYAYLSIDLHKIRWLRSAMQVSALVCGAAFLIWPTTLTYPAISGEGLSQRLLRFLSSADTSQNCLPSLHGALTLLCIWAIQDTKRKAHSGFIILWGVLIFFSILQLRRHITIDLGAGLIVGTLCGWLCMHWTKAGHSVGIQRTI